MERLLESDKLGPRRVRTGVEIRDLRHEFEMVRPEHQSHEHRELSRVRSHSEEPKRQISSKDHAKIDCFTGEGS